jgi:hypothetical protein
MKMLEEKLYPVLDALPKTRKATVCDALRLTQTQREHYETQQKITAIGYDKHKKSLDDAVEALEEDISRNRWEGYDTHSDMMEEIVVEILQWLPTLWHVAVQDGSELRLPDGQEVQLIRECLLLCSTTVKALVNCNSRIDFDDSDFEVTITDFKNTTVYQADCTGVSHTLAWMWRELLVATAARSVATQAIESDIDRLKLKGKVYGFIRKDGREPDLIVFLNVRFSYSSFCLAEDKHRDGWNFWDAHWTQAMRTAASQILTSARIASLEKAPSVSSSSRPFLV